MQDLSYEELFKVWPQPYSLEEVYEKAIERAGKLGQNVARALGRPVEEAAYVGEDGGVACPVCHSNVIVVPKDLPYVACPVCYVRGVVTGDGGRMKVDWNMEDAAVPRFSHEAVKHHLEWLGSHYGKNFGHQGQLKQKAKELEAYGKLVRPE